LFCFVLFYSTLYVVLDFTSELLWFEIIDLNMYSLNEAWKGRKVDG
jgi:hypothetical protein